MSDLSEKIRAAFYAKVAVASVIGTGKASALYYGVAPETAVYPFLVFQRVPGVVDYAFTNTRIGERDRYFLKCYSDESCSTTKDPQELNEDILELALSALGNNLTISGGTVHMVQRVADIPELDEIVNDRTVYMNGCQIEIYAG